jgi:hypothetical protein
VETCGCQTFLLFRQDLPLIGEDLPLVGLDPLLIPEYLIQLPLITKDRAVIRLDVLLVLQHLIQLLLIREQPRLVSQDPALIGEHLTFAHAYSSSAASLRENARHAQSHRSRGPRSERTAYERQDDGCSIPVRSSIAVISADVAFSFAADAKTSAASTGYQSRRSRSSRPAVSKGSIAR